MDNLFLGDIIDDLILEVIFELHYGIATRKLSMDELFDASPFPVNSSELQQVTRSVAITVTCPNCSLPVGASRFAPHLEKCLSGGRRGSKKSNNISTKTKREVFEELLPRKVKQKTEIIDNHPQSLIIRIKLHNKEVLVKPQQRCGATQEEFDAIKFNRK